MEALEQQEKSLEEAIITRKMGLVRQCFENRKFSKKHRCSPNGPPVSAKEYLSCRYQQNAYLGSDGKTVKRGGTGRGKSFVQQQAERDASQLASLLDQILNEMPATPEIPSDPEGASEYAASSVKIRSVFDLYNQYEGDLRALNGKGINVEKFFKAIMGICHNRATAIVNREQKIESSSISRRRFAIRRFKDQIKVQATSLLGQATSSYNMAIKSLTSHSPPTNVRACLDGEPSYQLACMKTSQRTLQALLDGSDPHSVASITVTGVRSSLPPVNCAGLRSCVAQMDNMVVNLDREVASISGFKKRYVFMTNNGIQSFTQQMIDTMSPQTALLDQYEKFINQRLGAIGVDGVDFGRVEGEELPEFGPDGEEIIKAPTSLLGLIGGNASPPLIDFNSGGSQTAFSSISDKKEEIAERLADVEIANGELIATVEDCRQQELEKGADAIAGISADIEGAGCGYLTHFCGGGESPLNAITAPVGTGNEYTADAVQSLRSGIAGACVEGRKEGRKSDLELARLKAEFLDDGDSYLDRVRADGRALASVDDEPDKDNPFSIKRYKDIYSGLEETYDEMAGQISSVRSQGVRWKRLQKELDKIEDRLEQAQEDGDSLKEAKYGRAKIEKEREIEKVKAAIRAKDTSKLALQLDGDYEDYLGSFENAEARLKGRKSRLSRAGRLLDRLKSTRRKGIEADQNKHLGQQVASAQHCNRMIRDAKAKISALRKTEDRYDRGISSAVRTQ